MICETILHFVKNYGSLKQNHLVSAGCPEEEGDLTGEVNKKALSFLLIVAPSVQMHNAANDCPLEGVLMWHWLPQLLGRFSKKGVFL